jgi:uncharacterized membrane protein
MQRTRVGLGSNEGSVMTNTPAPVALAQRLESLGALDPVVRAVRPLVDALVSDPRRRDLLQGAWLGHAVHPALTDLPIGFWTSAATLDLIGGRQSRTAATRLTALGVVAAGPTAWTGWAEWAGAGPREQRVGVVHAAANGAAVVLFASSWRARRREQYLRGKALSAAGLVALGFGGQLGGHLVSARKVSSRHASFADDGSPGL